MSRFILVKILTIFLVFPLAMGMDEYSPKVACDAINIQDPPQTYEMSEVINLQNFTLEDGICFIYKNETSDIDRFEIVKKGKDPIHYFLDESKTSVTLDDIIKFKITNPKYSRDRKPNKKIIFDQTVAFIGHSRQLVTLKQTEEKKYFDNLYLKESSLSLSEKKRFLVQERNKIMEENFVVLPDQAKLNQKIVFYKKVGKDESIFYYVPSGNLFRVDDCVSIDIRQFFGSFFNQINTLFDFLISFIAILSISGINQKILKKLVV